MRPFKVTLVGLGDEVVRAWLPETFAAEGIDFLHRECTPEEDLARRAADADLVWIWGSRVITADRLSHLEECGAILRSGSGVDNVPVAEATRRNVLICNMPLAAAEEVSDHAIARQSAAQDALGSARPPERIAAGGAIPVGWDELTLEVGLPHAPYAPGRRDTPSD